MANIFTTYTSRAIGVTPTVVGTYTANSSTQATIIGLTVSNITNGAISANVSYHDGVNDTKLIVNAPIPSGGSLVPIGGDQKIVLGSGDSIRVTANTASSVDVVMSVLQIIA